MNARDVHLRLIATLPVRTHECVVRERPSGRSIGDAPLAKRRRERIAELVNAINPATGRRWTERDIAGLLGISRIAVQKHKRALAAGGFRRIPLSAGGSGKRGFPVVADPGTGEAVRSSVAHVELAWRRCIEKTLSRQRANPS